MGRKISGGRKKMEEEEEDALRDPFLEQTLKIPQDFISEMKEAFRYFDKVGNRGSILGSVVYYRVFFLTGTPPKSSKYKKVNLGRLG